MVLLRSVSPRYKSRKSKIEKFPAPWLVDPYCMGHHLCWHCLGPPLSKLFAGILFPSPVQYGVAGIPSCLKSMRNQLPKCLLPFFSHCSLSAAITAMSRKSPTPTSRCRLQHAPCSVPAPGEDNSPHLYATHNKPGRKRRFIFSTVPTRSEQ